LFPLGRDTSNIAIYGVLEHIGAFTVLGYALAEYGGRTYDAFARLAPRVLIVSTMLSAALEWLRGWNPMYGASGLLLVLTLLSSVFGVWLYLLQLAHVRALSAPRTIPSLGKVAA
jgi:hypothetical protein